MPKQAKANDQEPTKARTHAFIVYPESAPSDWKQQLKDAHLRFAISPMHQPDGEHSKPHYHVLFYNHGAPITAEGAKRKIPAGIPANGHVELVGDHNIQCRYLCHMDDKDKEQFEGDPHDLIEVMHGFPLDLSEHLSQEEQEAVEDEVMDYIREYNITEFAELCYSLKDAQLYTMYSYAKHHAYLFGAVVKSQRYMLAKETADTVEQVEDGADDGK